jgi:hyperosmotically inducible protein
MRVTVRILVLFASILALSSSAAAQMTPDREVALRVAASVRGYAPFSIFDDVNVAVGDGTVTLSGVVTMPYKRDELGVRTAKVEGVRRVVNDLRVLPVSKTDSDLRTRIAQAIYNHPDFLMYATMAHPSIHIIVERGRVDLTGSVANNIDRQLAYALAQQVPGTFEVKNSLRVDKQ